MLDDIREAIRIGKEAKLPVQISHIKMAQQRLGQILRCDHYGQRGEKSGTDITADAYPIHRVGVDDNGSRAEPQARRSAEVQRGITASAAHTSSDHSSREFPALKARRCKSFRFKWKSPVETYIEIVKKGGAA